MSMIFAFIVKCKDVLMRKVKMRFQKSLFAYISLLVSMNINASTVFSVTGIENIEWLELTTTVGKSRSQVEGLITSGGVLDGWRYATRTEVEYLYDSLWGGTVEGYSDDNYLGARLFFDAFGVHNFYGENGYDANGSSSWATIFGSTFECGYENNDSCQGLVAIYDMNFGAEINVGYFHDDYGLSSGLDSINDQLMISNLYGYPFVGSHLVKELTAVPVPAALLLFGSGLIGLASFAHRKK